MIGVVVVSHSRPLAEAAVALASTMAGATAPPIAVAAGIEGPAGPGIGTDAAAIAEAITGCDPGEGVLVLMDLGSAVMSAQLALELLDEETAARVQLSPAPLVEGLILAVAAAATGASLGVVAARAEASLGSKRDLLGVEAPALAAAARPDGLTRDVTVTSPVGLHLRPASLLAGLVASYDADVLISCVTTGRGPVPGDSLTDLLTLGAEQGDVLRVEAVGVQAQDVLDAIAALAATGLGDAGTEADANV